MRMNYGNFMKQTDWNNRVKRLLKSELVRRGISSDDLVKLLNGIGIIETRSSIDSKISRGTFSASFLIQCLNAIGCKNFIPDVEAFIIAETVEVYKTKRDNK